MPGEMTTGQSGYANVDQEHKATISEVVPTRHYWRILATVITALVALGAIYGLVVDRRFEWGIVFSYAFNPQILIGLLITLELTAISMAIGIILGVILAIMLRSKTHLVRGFSKVYIWFFRGTPVLVQLIFWYNFAALVPGIGVPGLFSVSVNSLISPLTAAILGLGLNEGAYMAEIVRAGILSVDQGQLDAGQSLGMTSHKIMRHVVLPQALRVIIPPTGNETIGMLKTTALVSVIAMSDMLYSAEKIYAVNYEIIPLLITVSLWYLAVTSVLTWCQTRIENRLARGRSARDAGVGEAALSSSRLRRDRWGWR
jgi:polar amino acid transport system permease protein